MNEYEAQRAANIARNRALLSSLDLPAAASAAAPPRPARPSKPTTTSSTSRTKRRKLALPPTAPTRTSARLAAGPARSPPRYTSPPPSPSRRRRARPTPGARALPKNTQHPAPPTSVAPPPASTAELVAAWPAWDATGAAPTRDAETGRLGFADEPDFTPNVTPEEMLRAGVFGGSYFRAYHSRALRVTVEGDWRELPGEWTEGLDVERVVCSATYDAGVNRYKVACGQSIEEWEAAGWVDLRWDVRGWFQWYCRFYAGRRCEDDERQVGRWRRCVGERGRWRRLLLKEFVREGVRVVDEGDEVSPVKRQTCLHWAWEVRQGDLDAYWETGE